MSMEDREVAIARREMIDWLQNLEDFGGLSIFVERCILKYLTVESHLKASTLGFDEFIRPWGIHVGPCVSWAVGFEERRRRSADLQAEWLIKLEAVYTKEGLIDFLRQAKNDLNQSITEFNKKYEQNLGTV